MNAPNSRPNALKKSDEIVKDQRSVRTVWTEPKKSDRPITSGQLKVALARLGL